MNKTIIKNISYLLIVFAGMFLMQSCTDEIPRVLEGKVLSLEAKSLSLSANSVYFDSYEKSSRNVTVRAENMEWEFTDIPEWISVTPASGVGETDVRIEVSENTDAVNRVGMLTFRYVGSAWNYSMAFTVSQFRAPYSISLPVDTLQVLSESTTRTVQVDANTETWTIVVPESMSWCTARKAEGGMVITVDENKSAETRKGVIELHTDDVSAYLAVTQHWAGVKSVIDGADFPVEGGLQSMAVGVSASWSIENIYSWIDVKTMSGDAGFANLPIEVTPNYDLKSRDGFIYIVIAQDNKIAIPVHQEGISFSVDRSISVPSVDYTSRFNIRSNMPWRFCVDSIPDWITFDPESGNGSMQVIVKTKTNRAMRTRTASLPIDILTQGGNSILGHTSVGVSQEAFTFGADSSALYFSDMAGSMYFSIKSDDYWSAHSKESWISLSPDDGRGNSQIQVSVSENVDSTARIGSVILMTEGHRDTIPVCQAGKFINVSSKALTFQSKGDSVAVSLSANGPWTASASASWINLSATEGDGNCDISITVKDNPFTSSRAGEVIVTRGGYNPVRIGIRQTGRYLSLSSNYIVFFEKGGTSEPITVQTDGKYNVQTEYGWITISKETESQFTLTASENTSSYSRTATVVVYLTDLTSGTLQRTITVIQGTHFEAEYVDLGLSVCWATCNMGASTPYEYGGLYAWGELNTKSSYVWSTYRYCNGTQTSQTKYNSYSDYGYNGFVDYKTKLEPIDDIARVMWGEEWRMPTIEEFEELINNCTWEWVTIDNVEGYLVTSCIPGYTDRSIFLRSSGGDFGTGYGRRATDNGWYRVADAGVIPARTDMLYINKNIYGTSNGNERERGFSVRAVRQSPRAQEASLTLSRSALCIEENGDYTLTATVKQNYEVMNDAVVTFSSSDNRIATVSNTGVINAVKAGTCTITAESGTARAECRINVTSAHVDPQMVDLGLSVKWATFNVGAVSPEEVGCFFAWGETEEKTTYSRYTYKFNSGDYYTKTVKYCDNTDWGIRDDKNTLDPDDDVATVLWGNDWRMPTYAEMDDLLEKCTWTWTTINGVEGYKVTSNVAGYTDRFIFLPAAGICNDEWHMGSGRTGHYLTSSTSNAGYAAAWKLCFDQSGSIKRIGANRFFGHSIRPVAKNPDEKKNMIPEPVDLGLSVDWATFNLGASSPGEYGDYFSWGEITNKGYYSLDSYIYNYDQYLDMTSKENISGTKYDAAHVRLGSGWRMPTKEECEELVNNCTWSWEQYDGGNWGMKVTALNGNSIFLPAGGYPNPSWMQVGSYGTYWTSTKSTFRSSSSIGSNYSYYFRFNESMHEITDYQGATYVGQLLRPVRTSSTYNSQVTTGYENGHEYIDLGLSVKWASCNVGATEPEGYGDYYAWGEIEAKSSYTWTNYSFLKDGDSEDNLTLKKYNTESSRGQIDNIITLDPEDDVAQVKWGGKWRIPTMEELNELQDSCSWILTTKNDVVGYLITSNKTGYTNSSIFLPYAGYYEDSSFLSAGECCRYWSSSLDPDDPCRAGRLALGTPKVNWYSGRRFVGFSMRPVCP